MSKSGIEELLNCEALPTPPATAMKVAALCRREDASWEEVALVVSGDPALAAKLLQLVNSSFFGLRRHVTSVHQAISLLGLRATQSLALGFSLLGELVGGDEWHGQLVAMVRLAVYRGVAAQILADASGRVDGDGAFVGGLLQDFGGLALLRVYGQRYAALLAQADDDQTLAMLERGELGFDHAEVGGALAEKWSLPPVIVAQIRYHLAPAAAPNALRFDVELACWADKMAAGICRGGDVDHVAADACVWIGLGAEIVPGLLAKLTGSARDICEVFRIRAAAQ